MGLIRLFFSRYTPGWAKLIFGLLALVYFVSPIDAFPDYPLFGLGWLDDATVAAVLMWVATRFASVHEAKSERDEDRPRRKSVQNVAAKKARDAGPVGERSDGMRRQA